MKGYGLGAGMAKTPAPKTEGTLTPASTPEAEAPKIVIAKPQAAAPAPAKPDVMKIRKIVF